MLRAIFLTLLLPLIVLTGSMEANGQAIELRPATAVTAGGMNLDAGDFAIPCVTDWNGDGRKDLLVGYRFADKIAVYLNSGTDDNPVFTSFSNLQAGGTDIVVTGSSCGAPAPWVCDFDGDGARDLLVGSGLDGTVSFFRNTNTDAAPILAPRVMLRAGSANLSVGARATPYIHDWDEDGLPDLLSGDANGNVHWFRNTNTVQAPVYAPDVPLQAGGGPLYLGIRSVVRVQDWDGDGRKDVVGSSSLAVYWCRNTNNNQNPLLQAPVMLNVPTANGTLANIAVSTRMRLDLADWNNDGVSDLLLGCADGTVLLYEGYRTGLQSITRRGDSVVLQWDSAPYLRYAVMAGSSLSDMTEVVGYLPSGGKTTSFTNAVSAGNRFFRVHQNP